MQVSIYNSIEEIQAVWQPFQKSAHCYGFQTYEWLHQWYQTIGPALGAQPCIVVVADNRQAPLMILPLVIQKKLGIDCLTFADGQVADYNAPLVSSTFAREVDQIDFGDIWRTICAALPPCDVIHFQKMPATIHQALNPFLNLKIAPFHENSYALKLTDTWEIYWQTKVKKKLRADSNRQRRRLSGLGNLRFRTVTDPIEIEALTRTMIKQKRRRYRETGVPDLFDNPVYARFYQQVACNLQAAGYMHLAVFQLDDTILAIHWGMVHNGRFYFLFPTFAGGQWSKFSPGRLLLVYLLEQAFAEKLDIFDFTIGGEAYKMDWCDTELRLYEYLQVNTAKGVLYQLANTLKNYIRRKPGLRARLRFFKSPL